MNLLCQGWRLTRKEQNPALRTSLLAPLSQPELDSLKLAALSVPAILPPLARPVGRSAPANEFTERPAQESAADRKTVNPGGRRSVEKKVW